MSSEAAHLPASNLPMWDVGDLPEPPRFRWRNWPALIGPGLVMTGIQIGGGEWLFGPEITAKYGGGLMWVATVAILLQVFYNLECARYALYCGEPVLSGFMRLPLGPRFWIGFVLLLNLNALIPGLSTHGAAILASLFLDRPPGEADRGLVTMLAYACLFGVAMPVLIGGKVYNVLQVVMTVKVFVVLGFCLVIGLVFVSWTNWWAVLSGFGKFGNVPVTDPVAGETVTNAFGYYFENGAWPLVSLANIAIVGAFAGYAGGGGLSNSTYSNFVRDKGWGMGSKVGAIPSAVGGHDIKLSHTGMVFPPTPENLRRWKGWWNTILRDQFIIWAPGCFLGMALPALISLEFAPYSELGHAAAKTEWSQALITADGLRHAPMYGPSMANLLWVIALFAGMMVMLPSQMAIVDDFSRRWTDAIWTSNKRIRGRWKPHQVKYIYYSILSFYVLWSFGCAYVFSNYGSPKLMTIVIANLNNLAIGATAFLLLWINLKFLPKPLRPRWYHRVGIILCGVFYLGLAVLVFIEKQWPMIQKYFN